MRPIIAPVSTIAALSWIILAGSVVADPWFSFGSRSERGSGDIVTEEREVGPFERIRLECSADLVVTIGEQTSVTVTTDDNLQDYIITEVISRRTLLIDSDGSYRARRSVLVEITVPQLSLLEVDGSGDVEIIDLKADAFEVELDGSGDIEFGGEIKELEISLNGSGGITIDDLISETINIELRGSGDIEMRGQTEMLELSLRGSGDIDARRLKADDVTVRVHGSGDVKVYAETDFDGAVYGSGDIDIYGDPRHLERHVAGSGDIKRH